MSNRVVAVRIRKGEKVFNVHGDKAGAEGVWLAEGQVQGLYEPQVRTTYKAGAFQVGSRYKGRRIGNRDLVLGFHIADTVLPWEFNDSQFRSVFDYQLDPWDTQSGPTTIEVETTMSGVRKLDVLMHEPPEFDAPLDPIMQQYGNVIFKLRAAEQPFWYEDEAVSVFQADTTSATGFVTVSNPTDNTLYQKFALTRATWNLPDVSWQGAAGARTPGGTHETRMLEKITVTDANGAAWVDRDRSRLSFRDANDTLMIAQQAGKFLVYAIPPHTPPTPLPISYTDAPAGGARAELVQPRLWTRPWGGEFANTVSYVPPLGTTRFVVPGSWSYQIPPAATHLDVVMLGGGGGGGSGSAVVTGTGGSAGSWATITLERGVDIPSEVAVLWGEVGAGGRGGRWQVFNPGRGESGKPSTCMPIQLVAAGGVGEGHTGHVSGDDVHGPTLEFNGQNYTGGSTQHTPSESGLIPAGGGAGGWPITRGGDGARGQVWVRAYVA